MENASRLHNICLLLANGNCIDVLLMVKAFIKLTNEKWTRESS